MNNTPKADGFTRQFLKTEIVEQGLSYVNHDKVDPSNPFKTVTHHRTFQTDKALRAEISKLIVLKVPTKAHMSIQELLNLPMDIYEIIISGCIEDAKLTDTRNGAIASELENELAKTAEVLKK